MIICPECTAPLDRQDLFLWKCVCGAKYQKEDNIWRFAIDSEAIFEDHTEESIQTLAENVGHHFWLLERKRIVVSAVQRYLERGDQFLDIGVGACDIACDLRTAGFDVLLADVQSQSLKMGKDLLFENLFQFDIYKPIFRDHVEGIGVFDVLEHLDDDQNAVANLLQMVVPGGYIFATVPAFQSLWNNRDVMEKHKRRYRRFQLEQLFRSQGADVLSCRYIFFSIFPLLALRALFSRLFAKNSFNLDDYRSQFEINPLVNHLLGKLTRAEERCFGRKGAPFGGSLFLIAQRAKRQ